MHPPPANLAPQANRGAVGRFLSELLLATRAGGGGGGGGGKGVGGGAAARGGTRGGTAGGAKTSRGGVDGSSMRRRSTVAGGAASLPLEVVSAHLCFLKGRRCGLPGCGLPVALCLREGVRAASATCGAIQSSQRIVQPTTNVMRTNPTPATRNKAAAGRMV